MSGDLAGRHAVVTGGGRGIGAAVASELARRGARLTLMGRDRRTLDAHASAITQAHGVEVAAVQCDVSSEPAVAGAFGEAKRRFGEPFILVNNAGQAAASTLADTTMELWSRILAVNLTGPFLCMRQVIPAMVAAREGRIINVASVSGVKAYQRVAAYTASKHGLIGLTRSAAAETARAGVTVNAVCPGYTSTEMVETAATNLMRTGKTRDEALAMMLRTLPRGSFITPEEVAGTVGWLCSVEAAAISGQAIVLAGGEA